MEQILQTLLSMLIVFVAARVISNEYPKSIRRDWVWLLVLAPLVTSARFEGMFLIIAICGLLLVFKHWTFALAVGLAGFSPPVLNGIISVSSGWFWLPTSVLLKAFYPDFSSLSSLLLSLINDFYLNLRLGPHMFALLVAVILLYVLWFAEAMPSEWVRVGQWTIRNNLSAARDTVSFYALDPAEAAHLAECLRDFSPDLPGDVIQRGEYLSWGNEIRKP